jgi:predicted transcriptional regulator
MFHARQELLRRSVPHASVILSLRPRWAELILTGAKTVELRRRRPQRPFDTVYLYVSSPVQAIVARCRVTRSLSDTPGRLLERFAEEACLTAREGARYFHGAKIGSALFLEDVVTPRSPLPLGDLRRARPRFHPPQNFCYVPGVVLDLLEESFRIAPSNAVGNSLSE